MIKHPGPWRYQGGLVLDAVGSVVADDLHVPLRLTNDDKDDRSKEATERLILAAPELLEALKAICEAVGPEPGGPQGAPGGVWQTALELIARVEGR